MTRLLLPLLILLLLISLVGNYVLYQSSEQYYWELNGTRLDPLGLSSYPTAGQVAAGQPGSQQSKPDMPRVVMVGDSRAFAWPKPKVSLEYDYVGRGVGAQTSAQVLGRFAQHVLSLQPDIIILQVGINDLKTIPLFPDAKQQIVEQCKQNISQMVEHSLAADAQVIVTTIFPHGDVSLQRSFFWSPEVTEAIAEVNQFLVSMAAERVFVFDSAAVLTDTDGLVRSEYQFDLLHLNQQGYTALNQSLQPLLESLLESLLKSVVTK